MFTTVRAFMVASILCGAATAQAQYSNRSLGLGFGATKISADREPIQWALPISLEGSFYIDSGFGMTGRAGVMVMFDPASNTQVLGLSIMLGARYLFLEEWVRPYIGLSLANLDIFRTTGTEVFFGPGPELGVDFMVSDGVSLGLRGFATFYLTLNVPVHISYGGSANVHVYF